MMSAALQSSLVAVVIGVLLGFVWVAGRQAHQPTVLLALPAILAYEVIQFIVIHFHSPVVK
jgi:hypothetical protein